MRRSPILSEDDAFRLTVAEGVALVLFCCLVGWTTTAVAGAVVFGALASVVFALYMVRSDRGRRPPLRSAAEEAASHAPAPAKRHVLVVANEALAGEELGDYIRGIDGGRVVLDILAPVLLSRTHLAYTDVDAETCQALDRLSRSLTWARMQGFAARGEIGDPNPTTALEDELRDFGADAVIVATSERRPRRRQAPSELEQLREELDVPVVEMAVD
ncbi:MAG TPA: hypothetical protein VHT27_03845 [Solirubrobacteraceae bacterium]|jgi:hypothetical protein|nr:hypothetical protein [Solirubrobacteraceae bacterium]